jgi:hypothetical protein
MRSANASEALKLIWTTGGGRCLATSGTIDSTGTAAGRFAVADDSWAASSAPLTRLGLKFTRPAEVGLSRQQAFMRVVRNRVLLDQLGSGAINLWMPRLHAADAVESRRSSFAAARDGQTTPPLGIFDRSRVKSWLEAMDRQFLGVKSWMP